VIKDLIVAYRLSGQVYTVIPTEEAKIAMRNRLRRAQSLLSHVLDYGGKQTLRELRLRHGFKHDECIALATEFPGLLRYEKTQPGRKGGHPSEVLIAARNQRQNIARF
jgi:hypothetical protein